jgi:folate-binding protein YgfZ
VARPFARDLTQDEAAQAGMAHPGLLRIRGRDAAAFLHSQLTNEVNELEPGQGNAQARVSRTGHLENLFSLHRVRDRSDDPHFVAVLPSHRVMPLHDALDAYLFSDIVLLEPEPSRCWIAVQGPTSDAVLDAVFGPVGFEPWSTLPDGAIRTLRRARKTWNLEVPAGTFAIRRSLTGDVGFLVSFPGATPPEGLDAALSAAAAEHGAAVLDAEDFAATLDILRIEAGHARIGPETTPKKRLLPETGLEQSTVSYTKGCYMGQEVIARVRTYGSVPNLLRALVLPSDGTFDAAGMPALPAPGEALLDATTGKRVGHIASHTYSPLKGAPVAMAYLGRNVRAPGTTLSLRSEDGQAFQAEVALLPLYSAPDAQARVAQLYDLAIRTFADGDATGALARLNEALELDPTFADGYEAIGVILGKAGKYHEAIDFFRRLEEVAPHEPLVNTNLSLYYMKLGDKQTAEDEAGKATLKSMNKHRGDKAGDVEADLAKAKLRDAQRKQDMFRRVLEIDEADPIALFGMGNALLVLGNHAEAVHHLERAIEVDKNNSAVYAAHGAALEKLERLEEAVAVYQAGVQVASRKGDLMPLKQMEHRLLLLGARRTSAS